MAEVTSEKQALPGVVPPEQTAKSVKDNGKLLERPSNAVWTSLLARSLSCPWPASCPSKIFLSRLPSIPNGGIILKQKWRQTSYCLPSEKSGPSTHVPTTPLKSPPPAEYGKRLPTPAQ